MKKILVILLLMSINAGAQTGPINQQDRVRFSCSRGANPLKATTTMLVGVIDWRGMEGSAELALLSRNNCQTSETPKFKTVKRVKTDVFYKETATEVIVQMTGGNRRQDLSIIWRSEFPQEMPREHKFIVDGKTYSFDECHVRETREEEQTDRHRHEDVCPQPRYDQRDFLENLF